MEEDQPHYRDAGPQKGETGNQKMVRVGRTLWKLKGCSRSQPSKRTTQRGVWHRERWGVGNQQVKRQQEGLWTEKALIPDEDKTSARHLQPSRKERGFSTWRWRWTQKHNCPPAHFRISPAPPRVLSGKTGRS